MFLLKNKKIVIATIAVFAVLGLTWLALSHLPLKGNVDVRWPAKSQNHTLLLRPASSAESTRLVDYAPDHITITGMRIEYRDGRTALVKYQDGKPVSIDEYFADDTKADPGSADKTNQLASLKLLNDGLSTRHLHSVTLLKDDGKTIKSLTMYNTTGGLAAVGVRDADDDLALTLYGGSGSSGIASVAVFDGSSGALKFEQDFRADGSLASTYTTQLAGGPQAKKTEFGANGNKTREIVYNSSDDIAISDYAADGQTLVSKTSFGYTGITVTSYDDSGRPASERTFVDDTHISVRFFGKDGTATFKQNWVKLDTSAVPADRVGVVNDGFVLDEVWEFHNDGVSSKMDVNFFPGGKVVKEVDTRPTADYRPSLNQHFRDDGSLDYTDDCPPPSGGWTCKSTKMPDGPNKVRATLPAESLKVIPLLPAPSAQKPTAPTMNLSIDLS